VFCTVIKSLAEQNTDAGLSPHSHFYYFNGLMAQPYKSGGFLLLRAWVRVSCADFKGKDNTYNTQINILN
jgi:hypothetical protein